MNAFQLTPDIFINVCVCTWMWVCVCVQLCMCVSGFRQTDSGPVHVVSSRDMQLSLINPSVSNLLLLLHQSLVRLLLRLLFLLLVLFAFSGGDFCFCVVFRCFIGLLVLLIWMLRILIRSLFHSCLLQLVAHIIWSTVELEEYMILF